MLFESLCQFSRIPPAFESLFLVCFLHTKSSVHSLKNAVLLSAGFLLSLHIIVLCHVGMLHV